MSQRDNFDKAVSFVKRDGIHELVGWLETTDFFTAPSSTMFHGNHEGGLLDHVMTVLQFSLHNFNYVVKQKPELEYLRESVVICALFHDLCKVGKYVLKKKWTKDESQNRWKEYTGYDVETKLPLGHGELSLYLLSRYVRLTDAEAMAVRWHMGEFEPSVHFKGSEQYYAYFQAAEHPLVRIIHCSDMLSMIVEEKRDPRS